MNEFKGTGPEGIPTRLQKKFLAVSRKSNASDTMEELADKAGVSRETVSKWFANDDFAAWWLKSHYDGVRAFYTEKLVRRICERALSDKANSRDIELALKVLAPERLAKLNQVSQPRQTVIQFIAGGNKIDMPVIEASLPPEPTLMTKDAREIEVEVLDVETDVA